VNNQRAIPKRDIAMSIFSVFVTRKVPYFHAKNVSILCNMTRTPTRYTDSPTPEKIDAKNMIAMENVIINHPEKLGMVSHRKIEYI
jgi:hypothetical protein